MLEIYNEQVRDLLVKTKPPHGGLKVRQNPKSGFYVEGLKVGLLVITAWSVRARDKLTNETLKCSQTARNVQHMKHVQTFCTCFICCTFAAIMTPKIE